VRSLKEDESNVGEQPLMQKLDPKKKKEFKKGK